MTEPAPQSDATPAAPGPKSRSWLYEIPIFYAALFAAQRALFPDDPGLRGFNPSPWWLGVLLFSLRYGMPAGVASGAVSAALLTLGIRSAGQTFRLEDADFYLQPGLYLVAGAALGAVADRFAHRLAGLQRRIEDLLGRIRGLQNQIQAQQRALRAIEQQVVSQMSSVVTLYHGSRELGTLDRASLLPAILDFFTRALQAAKTGLYIPGPEGWTLMDSKGWKENEYPREVRRGEGLVGRAGAERRVVSLRDFLAADLEMEMKEYGSPSPRPEAIMAAPLLSPKGEVAAVFAVQAMPFLRFNSASVNLLALLAEWGSESLAKCLKVEDLQSRSLLDEELGVHSSLYFGQRLRQEFDRSRRYALPFSVAMVTIDESAVHPERASSLRRTVARVLREAVRSIDIVARAPYEDVSFAVLLITAPKEQALAIRERVLETLADAGIPGAIKIAVGAYSHQMTQVEELVEQAWSQLKN